MNDAWRISHYKTNLSLKLLPSCLNLFNLLSKSPISCPDELLLKAACKARDLTRQSTLSVWMTEHLLAWATTPFVCLCKTQLEPTHSRCSNCANRNPNRPECASMFASVGTNSAAYHYMQLDGLIWMDRPLSSNLGEPWDDSGNTLTAGLTVPHILLRLCMCLCGVAAKCDHMVRITGICQGAVCWNWTADVRHMGNIQALYLKQHLPIHGLRQYRRY